MKKTLIIHPEDYTTEFLKPIYKPIKNKTVVNCGLSKQDIKELIIDHDRIMMMGHGCPDGLFSVDKFKDTPLIIDETFVPYLETKIDNVYIWCDANIFVSKNKLKGFYSGMFISDLFECYYCNIFNVTTKMVNDSNYNFSKILSKYINNTNDIIYENVKREYGQIGESNNIAFYNNNRIFLS